MRKTHLRCVVDAELGVYQTLCGLRVSSKRPVTEEEAEVSCAVCKQIIEAYNQERAEKAAKRKAKKEAEAAQPVEQSEAKPAKKPRKKKKGNENEEGQEGEAQP